MKLCPSEGLDVQAFLLPFAARLATTVECAKASIDGALVCFRSKLVCICCCWTSGRSFFCRVGRAVNGAIGAAECISTCKTYNSRD